MKKTFLFIAILCSVISVSAQNTQPPDVEKVIIEEKGNANPDSIYTNTEIDASFPGGQQAWQKYLMSSPIISKATTNAMKKGIKDSTYEVVVRFVVDKEGVISDVIPLTQFGYGLENAALEVIKKGPKWFPAIQNGRSVGSYRRQKIIFWIKRN